MKFCGFRKNGQPSGADTGPTATNARNPIAFQFGRFIVTPIPDEQISFARSDSNGQWRVEQWTHIERIRTWAIVITDLGLATTAQEDPYRVHRIQCTMKAARLFLSANPSHSAAPKPPPLRNP